MPVLCSLGSGQISNVINGAGGTASSATVATLEPPASYAGTGTCTATTPPVGSTVPLTTIPKPNPNNFDTPEIMQALYVWHPDLVLLAPHRGIHALPGLSQTPNVPENSLQSIGLAAQAGWEMVELDVKLTSDGVPILTHDRSLGPQGGGLSNLV